MNLVFLDIDGVLNSQEFWMRYGAAGGRGGLDGIDGAAMLRLNRLVHFSDAQVIVSSSWRGYGLTALDEAFRNKGANFSPSGITPTHPDGDRAHEIWAYLVAHFGWAEVPRAIILDDEDITAPLGNHGPTIQSEPRRMLRGCLVQTDHQVGLTDADVDRALAILRGQSR